MKHFGGFKEMSLLLPAVHHFLLHSVVHIPKIIRAGTQEWEGYCLPWQAEKGRGEAVKVCRDKRDFRQPGVMGKPFPAKDQLGSGQGRNSPSPGTGNAESSSGV